MPAGWVAAAAAVITVVGAEESKKAVRGAAGDRRNLDRENRLRYEKEVVESVRRTKYQQGVIESQAKASSGSSGFAIGSSLDKYVKTVEAQHERDIDWMKTSGASISAIMESEASARQRASNNAAQGKYISDWGRAIGYAGSAYSSFSTGGSSSSTSGVGSNSQSKYGWGYA